MVAVFGGLWGTLFGAQVSEAEASSTVDHKEEGESQEGDDAEAAEDVCNPVSESAGQDHGGPLVKVADKVVDTAAADEPAQTPAGIRSANVDAQRVAGARADFTEEEIRRLAPRRPGVYYSELVESRQCIGRHSGESCWRKWGGRMMRSRQEARDEVLKWLYDKDKEKFLAASRDEKGGERQ